MALDVQAIARRLGGTVAAHGITERTRVDRVTPLDEFLVVGNPEYSTLVTGEADSLEIRLAQAGTSEDAILGAVFVTNKDTTELRALLSQHGMTAVLGCRCSGATLFQSLRAMLAEDVAASDRLATAGMNVLTQVARRGGVTAVMAELVHRVDGWAVLLDAAGDPIATAGAGRLHVADAISVALGRAVRVRHPGLQVHQVGTDQDLVGHLVIATRSGATSRARDLAEQAAALCDLLLRTSNPSRTENLGRAALIDVLDAGGRPSQDLLRRWGVHEQVLTAFAVGTRTRTIDVERLVRRWLDELGAEHMFTFSGSVARGYVRADLADALVSLVSRHVAVGDVPLSLGLGEPSPVDRLVRSAAQARQALESALENGERTVRFSRLATVELVLKNLAGPANDSLKLLLQPLTQADGAQGDLTLTLRVFLAEHGAHRRSAGRLGIHRQTLHARLQRIEELTGLSLDRADDRAAAWFALRASGQ
ncbi:PucR family transcriptional regulator [Leucobacter salsicius]|uniref:PucR family transcriptional regulator n=1 Tax=Leucobacter salsicius TaxID=664638 RepID=UPI0003457744|nr:helix-turn-helix domain-containing protein [Leucobacter salsicius]